MTDPEIIHGHPTPAPDRSWLACPWCQSPKSRVITTRQKKWRRRRCEACGRTFRTEERIIGLDPVAQ